jgi:hypothetical protein
MENDKNGLVYQKANTYRLHADNLRWTLFAGYLAVFGTVYKFCGFEIYLALWFFSLLYLFIMSVQHWFYNLFSQYTADCEERILHDKPLMSLKTFAKHCGAFIKLDHPAYTFALVIVSICASIFCSRSLFFSKSLIEFFRSNKCFGSDNYSRNIYIISMIVHILFVVSLSRCWRKFIYNIIIKGWANLWGGSFGFDSDIEIKLDEDKYKALPDCIKEMYEYESEYKEYYLKEKLTRMKKKIIKVYFQAQKKKQQEKKHSSKKICMLFINISGGCCYAKGSLYIFDGSREWHCRLRPVCRFLHRKPPARPHRLQRRRRHKPQ